MGGIQVVLVGDFHQLPPVPNKYTGDRGAWAFESQNWSNIVPHVIELTTVQRQHDADFIECINEVARGRVSQKSSRIIASMKSSKLRKTHLFPKRLSAELYNAQQLTELEGQPKYYSSREGQRIPVKLRNSVTAPQVLALKFDAPVVLTVNLSNKLVNGLDGYVKGMSDTCVSIYFPLLKETADVPYFDFYRFSLKAGCDMFICSQIPLILSFGLTIHRCQGMTLASVALHCEGAFAPGQIGVGLSRVCSPEDVTVIGFRPSLCAPHGQTLHSFYEGLSQFVKNIEDDLTCCRMENIDVDCLPSLNMDDDDSHNMNTHHDDQDDDADDDVEEEDFYDEQPLSEDDSNGHSNSLSLPYDLTAPQLRQKLMYDRPFTNTQKEINRILDIVTDSKLESWTKEQLQHLNDLIAKHGVKSTKESNQVISQFLHNYPLSTQFVDFQKQLFLTESISKVHQIICVNALVRIENVIFSTKSKECEETEVVKSNYPTQTTSVKSKIRYVGGMCVGKILFPETQYLSRHCYEHSSAWEEKKKCVTALHNHIFPSLCIAKSESSFQDSLQEIQHRQTIYGHLTIIDDALFTMFLKYDEILYPYMSKEKMSQWKGSFFSTVIEKSLDQLFQDANVHIPSDLSRPIFRLLAVKYLKVSMKEWKYRIITEEDIKKRASHRKAILMDSTGLDEEMHASKKAKTTSSASVTNDTHEESTSTEQTSDDADCLCVLCNVSWLTTSRLQWIECAKCRKWLHRKCDKALRSHKLWKRLTTTDETHTCPQCRDWSRGESIGYSALTWPQLWPWNVVSLCIIPILVVPIFITHTHIYIGL